MDPEEAGYVCTLSEYSLEKARRELNEDPKQRLGAVQTLRQWVREQPHYTCRTDTNFLLNILRRAKFSQLVAREIVNNIMTMQTKCPEYMANLDLQDPSTLAFIEHGISVYPPKRDSEGRAIAIIRPGQIPLDDPKFSPLNDVRCNLAMGELFRLLDEDVTVNGVLLVFDLTGVGTKFLSRATMDHQRKTSKIYQDCQPNRVKAFLLYNGGTIIEILLGLMKQFMKKKNQERIQVHDNMETLYKIIPMEYWPDEYLPDDYTGPSAGSIKDIAAFWKNHMMNPEKRKQVLEYTHERFKIDESKRPMDEGHLPRQESFRKLEVD